VVTVTGPAGVGKTRVALAMAAAAGAINRCDDGRWLVDLAAVTDGAAVVGTVSAAIGELGAGVAGERVLRLEPLAVPAPEETSPTVIVACDAVRLFLERWSPGSDRSELTDDEVVLIGRICRATDGLPRQLEGAAAACRRMDLASLVGALDAGDDVPLPLAPRNTSGPTGTTNEVDQDWLLLTSGEAALMRRLSVFVGGWSLDAAGHVCGGDGIDRHMVAQLQAALADKSLIVADPDDPARHRMLETVRRAARRKATGAGEAEGLRRRHAEWYLTLVEGDAADLVSVADEAWLRRLDPDLDNLRAALDWARTEGEVEVGVRLVSSMVKFWEFRGHLHEALDWVSWAMSHDAAQTPPLVRATVVRRAAVVHSRLGDAQGAQALAEQAAALYQGIGDAEGAAIARHFISLCRSPRDTLPALDESVGLARAAGEVNALAHLLSTRGQAQFFLGQAGLARRDFTECLQMGRREGHGDALLLGLLGLARVDLLAGNFAAVARELGDAVALAERADDRPSHDIGLALSGELARRQGDYATSWARLDTALERARADGEPLAVARAQLFLGRLCQATGAADEARRCFEEALDLGRRANGPPYHEVRCLLGLAAARMQAGDAGAARELADQAGAIAGANDDRQGSADCLVLVAGLMRITGQDGDVGIRMGQKALKLYEAVGDVPGLTAGMETVAGLLVDEGWCEAAAALLGATEALRETGGYVRPPVDDDDYGQTVGAVADSLGDRWEQARMEGRTLSASEAVATACEDRSRLSRGSRGEQDLTAAEREVARLVVTGLTNAETAARLFVSRRTIDTHLSHIYLKLGIHSRRELSRWADGANGR